MRIKRSIPDLYRSEWLDIANFVFVSACINCGHTAEEGIKRFQRFMNLDEDQLDTDSLKTSFYRSQRKFRDTVRVDRPNFMLEPQPENITKDDLQKMMNTLIEELKTGQKRPRS